MRKFTYERKVDGTYVAVKSWPVKHKKAKPPKPKQSEQQAVNQPKKKNNSRKKTLNSAFYRSHAWARARYQALKDSDGKCNLCGRGAHDGAVLHVDHIKSIYRYPHLALDQDNLQVLCQACNWGKWGVDESDWRKCQSEWAWLTPIKD